MGKLAIAKNGKVELPSGETLKVGSRQWFEWLEALDTKSFRVSSNDGNGYTCRKERAKGYWYGYRKVEGKLRKRYMGKSTDLTRAQLNKIKELLRVPTSPKLPKGVSEQPLDLNQELGSQWGNLQAENLSLESKPLELVNQKLNCEKWGDMVFEIVCYVQMLNDKLSTEDFPHTGLFLAKARGVLAEIDTQAALESGLRHPKRRF
ncbi:MULTISPECIES: hypothetical protein [Kamptonema]|uniref:hypothetical protein n=1 Tax=Kamptonema TaxID=1501433 RepID=UPI0001DAD27A|nr:MULTISPECIES: hypothetical protein [Kamptonema]CBN58291.1 hypothetical protein OSCI_3720010 [Kamptonema sp. PCC 6506]